MDHRGLLLLTMLLGVYTLNECAAFEPICKGKPLNDYYGFLVNLDLGYDSSKPKHSTGSEIDDETVSEIEKYTVCEIQKVCLSILQTAAKTPMSPYKFDSFKEFPLDALVILYNMNTLPDASVVYPLWLLHLYVKNIQTCYMRRFTYSQMICLDKMITTQLTSSMNGCPDGNRISMINKNDFQKIRQNLMRVTAANRSYELINSDNLLGGYVNVLQDNYNIDRIISEFGSFGEWGNVSSVFLEAHHKATDPTGLYTGMKGIGEYQTLFLTLLKMVILRIVCIHLLLVTDNNHLPEWNAAMLETVNSFADKTGLKEDETFVQTFRVLGDERPSPENSKEVIDCIRSDLATSSTAFDGCNVSMIAEEDIPRIFTNVGGIADIPAYIKTNLELAVGFVGKVEIWLLHVDQEFIKSVLALAYPIDENFGKDNLPALWHKYNQY